MSTDAKIKHDVIKELQWDPSLDASAVGVTVDHGVVALTGHVSSYAEKLAAEADEGIEPATPQHPRLWPENL